MGQAGLAARQRAEFPCHREGILSGCCLALARDQTRFLNAITFFCARWARDSTREWCAGGRAGIVRNASCDTHTHTRHCVPSQQQVSQVATTRTDFALADRSRRPCFEGPGTPKAPPVRSRTDFCLLLLLEWRKQKRSSYSTAPKLSHLTIPAARVVRLLARVGGAPAAFCQTSRSICVLAIRISHSSARDREFKFKWRENKRLVGSSSSSSRAL